MHAAIQILFVEEREHWVVSSFTNGKLRQVLAIRQLFNWRINLKSSSTASSNIRQSICGEQQTRSLHWACTTARRRNGLWCFLHTMLHMLRVRKMYERCNVWLTSNAFTHSALFEAKTFSPFPPSQNSAAINRCDPRQIIIELYYTCGLPETYDNQMIECTECQKWFH